VYRDSFRFCGRESFLLREENDRCTRTWCGLIHKLFFLQEDDDLFISNICVTNYFYCRRMTIFVPGLVSILWLGIIFFAGGERSVYQDLG
jgi:hypothetical protein